MKKFPKKIIYNKQHKIKKIKGKKGLSLKLFTFGLRLEKFSRLTFSQLESARKSLCVK